MEEQVIWFGEELLPEATQSYEEFIKVQGEEWIKVKALLASFFSTFPDCTSSYTEGILTIKPVNKQVQPIKIQLL